MLKRGRVLAIFLALPAATAFAFPNGEPAKAKPCIECHTLTREEAKTLLKNLGVDDVLGVQASEVKGLWTIDVESRGRKGPVYLDFSKKYAISGSLIRIDTMENLSQARAMELNKVDVSLIPLGDAIVVGKPAAKHKIIVFDDPECPYCQKLQPEMSKVVSKREDVAFFIKMFPLTIHPAAYEKAKAIVCEKSLQMLEDSLAGKPLPAPKCQSNQVDENLALAQRLGIGSTPTLIFPDGLVSPGYRPADGILELLDRPPSKPGQKP